MIDSDPNRPVQLDSDEARGGSTPGVTRYVLGASLVLVIIVFVAIYLIRY